LKKRLSLRFFELKKTERGVKMGTLSKQDAIAAYERILRDPNSTPQQKAIAEMALVSLREEKD
jgi:hypothetical protein